MKSKKNRLQRMFAIIMTMVMMITFTPSLSLAASSSAPDWTISWYIDDQITLTPGVYDPLDVFVDYANENYTPALEAMWYENGNPLLSSWEPVIMTNYRAEAAAELDEDDDPSDLDDIEEYWHTEWSAEEDGHYKVEVREVAHPEVIRSLECDVTFAGWSAHEEGGDDNYMGGDVTLKMVVSYVGERPDLTFKWYKLGLDLSEEILIEDATSDTLTVSEIGNYTCIVSDGIDECEGNFYVGLPAVKKNGLMFEAVSDDQCNVTEWWRYNHKIEDNECLASGDVVIPPSVTFADGKARAVKYVHGFTCFNANTITLPDSFTELPSRTFCECRFNSIYIPSSVTVIGEKAAGYYLNSNEEAVRIPGFIIFGENGSEAQRYAIRNGITFIDPVARKGVISSKLPKLTISKPAASKKAITVKWKKLSAKQKKNAQKIEIWICPNKAFGAKDTTIKTVSKTKSSYKVKGLKAKKKYYVKVRTIKKSGKIKYVSKWSKLRSIKTK